MEERTGDDGNGSRSGKRWGPWWGPGFDTERRGYDRGQVEEALDRAEADLKIMTADRDAMVRAEAVTRAEMDALRADVERLATAPLSLDGLTTRLQHLLRLAQEEADQVREQAGIDAQVLTERTRERARDTEQRAAARADEIVADADVRTRARLTEAAEQATVIVAEAERHARALRRDAEAALDALERRRDEVETEQAELVEHARAEAARLESDAADDRRRRDEDADLRRSLLEQDLEAALDARRAEATAALAAAEARRRHAEERRRAAEEEAAARVADSTTAVADLEQQRRRVAVQLAGLRQTLGLPAADDPAVPPVLVAAGEPATGEE